MSKKVLAALIPEPGAPVEVRELEEPELEDDSALLEVELSEVCGTDVHLQQGRLAGVPYPLIPGHVSVGRLGKIRGRLFDVDGRPFREGDAVTFLDVHRTCNACWHCLVAKASTRCPRRKVYGITYGAADGLCGGWAEKIYLKPGTRLIRLAPDAFENFMAGGCSLPTALHAIERAEVRLGDTVLVLGCGPVGLSSIIFARLSGALRVISTGAPAARLAAAREVGAHATLDIETHDERERLEWVLSETGGRGADVTIEATGVPRAVVEAMRYTRDAGRVVVVGQYTDHGDVSFNPHLDLNRKHLDVRGCWGSDFSHFYRGAQIISDPTLAAPWTR
ncbi:MAG TPA: zinc-binding dehydrogenase, partial [Pyrinomonadaceae bacterium]|nr:zinc-binding dehydrogenase [Pyrinomonadaceae bacterium]